MKHRVLEITRNVVKKNISHTDAVLVWMIIFFYLFIYIQVNLALLYFADIAFFTIRSLWQPSVERLLALVFQLAFAHFCASVSHSGSSYNISNVFMIIMFVMVICDQYSLLFLKLLGGARNSVQSLSPSLYNHMNCS